MKKYLLLLTLLLAVVVQTLAGVTNLANGKTAIASSGNATLAIDGDVRSRWESDHSDDQTWQVDLGEDKTFKSIVIVWETASSKSFTITAATAAEATFTNRYINNGSEVYTTSDNTTTGERYTQVINVNATTARYIKFHATKRNTEYGHSFYEFYVLEEPVAPELSSMRLQTSSEIVGTGGTVSLSLTDTYDQYGGDMTTVTGIDYSVITESGGTISGSTYTAPDTEKTVQIRAAGPNGLYSDATIEVINAQRLNITSDMVWVEEGSLYQGAGLAFDTDYNNIWTLHEDSQGQKNYQTGFVIDLKGTYEIKKIYTGFEASGPEDYTIEFSADGKEFTPVVTVEGRPQETKTDYQFGSFVEADRKNVRYVRFHCSKPGHSYGVKVQRFELYGSLETGVTDEKAGPTFTDGYPTISVEKTSAKVVLNATDTSGEYLYYTIQQVTPSSHDAETLRHTTMHSGNYTYTLEGLTVNTNYEFKVRAYDVFGNASEEKTVTFQTEDLSISAFTVTPTAISMAKNADVSEELTFKVIADDGSDITSKATFSAGKKSGDDGIVTFDTGTRKFSTQTDRVGDAVWTITANYGGSTMQADVEVYVYETALTMKYKTLDSNTYHSATGEMGKLKEALNTAIGGDDGYKSVYELKIESGNIDDTDIGTLRNMAGGTHDKIDGEYQVMANASLGNLHILDLKAAKFVSNTAYSLIPDEDDKAALKTNLEERMKYAYVITGDSTYTTQSEYNEGSEKQNVRPCIIPIGSYYVDIDHVNATGKTTGEDLQLVEVTIVGNDTGVGGHQILPDHIFDHCVNLESIVLPDGIKMFGTRCFNGCTNLKTVSNYEGVEDFGSYAFANTPLTTFDLTKNANLKSVGTGMFFRCQELKGVKMPSTIKVIYGSAFAFCPEFNLVDGALPADLEYIELHAFLQNESLTKVVFGENLKAIGTSAFDAASNNMDRAIVADFTNATSLKTIEYRAFADNHGLTILPENGQIPNSVQDIGDLAFANTNIKNLILPKNEHYQTIRYGCFGWSGRNLTSVTIPANVVHISDVAFVNDEKITMLDLQDKTTLKTIGESAFENCKGITNQMEGVSAVESIGIKGFKTCPGLTDKGANDLMQHLSRLNHEVFANTKLTDITLPASLTAMGDKVFAVSDSYTPTLKYVRVNASQAPAMDHADLTYTETYEEGGQNKKREVDADVFLGYGANQIEVVFTEDMKTKAADASKGYMSYRANKHFMKVMRRELDESAAEYTIPAQFGADVEMKRTMGARKWATLVLPFGLKDNYGRSAHTSSLLHEAIGAGSRIAAYRGLRTTSTPNTLMFLLYKGADELRAFQPVLAYTETDVSELTFTDVDVNYDDEGTVVQTGTLNDAAKDSYGGYVGNVGWGVKDENVESEGHELSKLQGTDKTTYMFCGTYKTIYNKDYKYSGVTTNSSNAVINDGDQYINSNMFYEVSNQSADKRYMQKGFRGWFKKVGSSTAKEGTLSIMAIDNMDDLSDRNGANIATAITYLDVQTGEEMKPQDIFTVSGTLVRRAATSTEGLKKGFYIVGGQKIVIR